MTELCAKILKDFSLDNYDNLFKGQREQWFLIDTKKERKDQYSLSQGEWKYYIRYYSPFNLDYRRLDIDGFTDLLDEDESAKIVDAITKLEIKYALRADEARACPTTTLLKTKPPENSKMSKPQKNLENESLFKLVAALGHQRIHPQSLIASLGFIGTHRAFIGVPRTGLVSPKPPSI